jgi:hypothetical protein
MSSVRSLRDFRTEIVQKLKEEAVDGSGGEAPGIIELCMKCRWVVSFTLLLFYPGEGSFRYPFDRMLGGLLSRSGWRIEKCGRLWREQSLASSALSGTPSNLGKLVRHERMKQYFCGNENGGHWTRVSLCACVCNSAAVVVSVQLLCDDTVGSLYSFQNHRNWKELDIPLVA